MIDDVELLDDFLVEVSLDESPTEMSVDDRSVQTFHGVALTLLVLSSIYLAALVRQGRVGIGYQGDEGLRVFDAYQSAFQYPNSEYGGVWQNARETLFGIHPPGDNLVRSVAAWTFDLVGFGVAPVSAMFLLSIVTVSIAHFFAADIARRAAGVAAGYLTLFLLFGSYVFSDIKLSSMGEAIAMPLMVGSLFLLQRTLDRSQSNHVVLIAAGVLFMLATLVRPEISLMLPGLCIALWYLVGFVRASVFGALAGAFELAKLANSFLFARDTDVSVLNVGSTYSNGRKSLDALWRSDFIQQLIREPGLVVFLLGILASFVFVLFVRERESLAWRTHLLVTSGTIAYLVVNVTSQILGWSPHSAYRIVIAISPTIIIGFSIAFVALGERCSTWLEESFGFDWAASIMLAGVVLLCAWGAYTFSTSRIDELQQRVPEGVRTSADAVLASAGADDAIFVDHMRYWENAVLGYLADRDAPVCNYARCSVADETAVALWDAVRDEVAVPGTTSDGEFTALRVHSFIREFEPTHIVIASEDVHRDWTRVARGTWGDEEPLWSSHIYPYLDGEVNFDQPQEQVLRIGLINGVEYFDAYVMLIPRSQNDVGIVYEAVYGHTPDQIG